ncbi:MAG: sulfite exporter TauE/SafE family protein [Treponemataceae bacterium]
MKIRIDGMHCSACTALVEREFAKVEGTVEVKASLSDQIAVVRWEGASQPELSKYRLRVEPFGYIVIDEKTQSVITRHSIVAELRSWFISVVLAGLFVAVYYGIQTAGFSSETASRSEATIAAAFLSGVAASVSSCLALVGSLVLALGAYANDGADRLAPIKRNSLFQAGRIVSFILLGGLLGLLGGGLAFSGKAAAVAALFGGAVALALGIGILVPKISGTNFIRLPRVFSRFLDIVSASKNPLAPILLGAATFFLPCGFALSMQAFALASGSFCAGAMIMGAFALGTAPVLMAAGLAGSWTKRRGPTLSRAAGLTIVAFSLFAISASVSLFGFGGDKGLRTVTVASSAPASSGPTETTPVATDPTSKASASSAVPAPVSVQRVEMRVGAYSFEPSEIRVKAGVPVEWVIIGENPSGCTNRIVVPGTDLSVPVKKGASQTVKFTIAEKGVIPFSCWMGMVHGKIIID